MLYSIIYIYIKSYAYSVDLFGKGNTTIVYVRCDKQNSAILVALKNNKQTNNAGAYCELIMF